MPVVLSFKMVGFRVKLYHTWAMLSKSVSCRFLFSTVSTPWCVKFTSAFSSSSVGFHWEYTANSLSIPMTNSPSLTHPLETGIGLNPSTVLIAMRRICIHLQMRKHFILLSFVALIGINDL